MNSSVIVSAYIHAYNHPPHQDTDYFQYPKVSLVPFPISRPHPTTRKPLSFYFLHIQFLLPILELHISEIIQNALFYLYFFCSGISFSCPWDSSSLLHLAVLFPFWLLCSIPFICTYYSLSFLLSMNIWVISGLVQCRLKLPWTFLYMCVYLYFSCE